MQRYVCLHIYYIWYLRQDLVSATPDKKETQDTYRIHPASLCCVTSCIRHSDRRDVGQNYQEASFATNLQCEKLEWASLLFEGAFGRTGVVVGEEEGEAGVVREEGWLLSSLLSAPSLGQAGRLCWAAQLLGSRCEPSCQRQAVARRSAARAHTSLSHLP